MTMTMEAFEEFLRSQGVDDALLAEVKAFREEYPREMEDRIGTLNYKFYGGEVWTQAILALLEGAHLLLSGPKATGKNVLCENLSFLFGRPQWTVSLNMTSDAHGLVASDTFKDGEVVLKPGPVYQAARYGGFGVLDEINMAKNEALSVIHSALDDRRILDIPGYDLLRLHPASRFLATMNDGYLGTRDLNEALVSRFLVLDMPAISQENLIKILMDHTGIRRDPAQLFSQLFMDLQDKSLHAEISSKSIDLRGLLYALQLMKRGLGIFPALDLGLANKCFDSYEKDLVQDTIKTLFSRDMKGQDFFD